MNYQHKINELNAATESYMRVLQVKLSSGEQVQCAACETVKANCPKWNVGCVVHPTRTEKRGFYFLCDTCLHSQVMQDKAANSMIAQVLEQIGAADTATVIQKVMGER